MNGLQTPSGPATRAARSRDPTPEEIRQRCAEIREGWDEREEARRRGVDRRAPGWAPLVVETGDVEAEPEG